MKIFKTKDGKVGSISDSRIHLLFDDEGILNGYLCNEDDRKWDYEKQKFLGKKYIFPIDILDVYNIDCNLLRYSSIAEAAYNEAKRISKKELSSSKEEKIRINKEQLEQDLKEKLIEIDLIKAKLSKLSKENLK